MADQAPEDDAARKAMSDALAELATRPPPDPSTHQLPKTNAAGAASGLFGVEPAKD